MTPNVAARAFGSGAALAAVLFAVFSWMNSAAVDHVAVPLNVAKNIHSRLAELEAARAEEGRFDVAFLGDSTVGGVDQEGSIPRHLEAESNRMLAADSRVRVTNLSSPGMGPFDYYFIADLVVQSRPDLVVMLLNLSTFSESFTATFRRPELAGWIPPGRFFEALALPLYRVGVTTDQLVVDMALAELGMLAPWRFVRREQARFNHAKNRLFKAIDAEIGAGNQAGFARTRMDHFGRRYNREGGKRLNEVGVEQRFGAALAGVEPDHFNLEMLAAAIRVFRAAPDARGDRDGGIPVLVYANPTNVENFRDLGALNEEGLALTLRRVAATVEELGAHWVDLHELFPDDHFRDPGGHFKRRDPNAPPVLGRALARALVASRTDRPRAKGSGARD